MLVLTRKRDESIIIDGDIKITIISIIGNAVRVGIDAPKEVKIVRKEIQNKPLRKSGPNTPLMGGK